MKITKLTAFMVVAITIVTVNVKAQTVIDPITVINQTPLESTAGSEKKVATFGNATSNGSRLIFSFKRHTAGTSWSTAATRIQALTDVTNQGYLEFNPNGLPGGLALGTDAKQNALTINSVGQVGIGINPSAKFQVDGGRISIYRAAAPGPARYHLFNGGGVAEWIFGQKSETLHDFTLSKLVAGVETDMFSINPSGTVSMGLGNVGIGTTTPSAKLDVEGIGGIAVAAGLNLDPNGDGTSAFFQKFANSGKLIVGWNRSAGAGEIDFISNRKAGNGGFSFSDLDNSGNVKKLMSIEGTTGDVRIIGNVSVDKTILTSRIKVFATTSANWNWADYVFAKEYQLKPLHEVEAYINANKHLEGIPTTEEVKKEGIDVAPVTAKLLEKIEELTLYMIEMKKQNDVQQQQIKELQELVNENHSLKK